MCVYVAGWCEVAVGACVEKQDCMVGVGDCCSVFVSVCVCTRAHGGRRECVYESVRGKVGVNVYR